MSIPNPTAAPLTLKHVFKRLNTDETDHISTADIKKVAVIAGAATGPLGRQKAKGAAKEFMDTFDTNRDGKVPYAEFAANGLELIPGVGNKAGVSLTQKGEIQRKAMEAFDRIDTNGDGKIDLQDLKAFVKEEYRKDRASMPGVKADIAAKISMYLVDHDADGVVTKEQIALLAADIERELLAANDPPAS